MFRRVLGSFRDAAWLRRQFTLDADIVHDVRHGARLLRRTPGFTLLTVTVLGLGIGATAGMFSVVDALLIRQLPYRDPERIVLLYEAATARRTDLQEVAPANFIDWQAAARSVDVMAAAEPSGFTYTGGSEPQSLPGMRVTTGFFEAWGMEAAVRAHVHARGIHAPDAIRSSSSAMARGRSGSAPTGRSSAGRSG